jgi:hypothetical protein
MRYVGIADGKMAILSAEGAIEKLGPLEGIQEKSLHVTTRLSSAQVLRREVFLKLKRPQDVLKALPFQLELPSTLDLVYPKLHPTESGTDVVVFATSASKVEEHLSQLEFEPDQISCEPIALARFMRFSFPEEKNLRWIYENTAIVLTDEKIVFAQHLEDPIRLKAFLDLKFPTHVDVGSHELQHQEFAIPIGLALDRDGCQFKKRKKQQKMKALMLSLSLAVLTGAIGLFLLHHQKSSLEQRVATYFSSGGNSLENQIFLWQQQLIDESKIFPLLPDIPSVSDTLAWLGVVEAPVEIVQFHYSLVKYPKAGEKNGTYSGKVELEFKAAGPKEAEELQARLQKNPTLVDTKQKVTWTAHQNCYKISFWLRKNLPTS